jgi:hypothetical protein
VKNVGAQKNKRKKIEIEMNWKRRKMHCKMRMTSVLGKLEKARMTNILGPDGV